jgi:WD40 repeat protein
MHGKFIYLASEDGTVKILKVKKTKIDFVRTLVKVEDRCLSLELVTTDSTASEKTIIKSLYAGYADSSIRKWELASGNSVLHFQKLTKKHQKQTGSCFIWKLRLSKGFLISGDSMGDVTVWDPQFGTLVKRFNNLKGDINALEVNEDFGAVYASGVDSRVAVIQLKESKDN